MAIAFCNDCEEPISLGPNPKVGQRIVCSHCDAELEVISVSPLALDWALDETGEEWEGEEADEWGDEDDEEWDDEDDDWEEDEIWEDDDEEDDG